jgi:hypothetical protein
MGTWIGRGGLALLLLGACGKIEDKPGVDGGADDGGDDEGDDGGTDTTPPTVMSTEPAIYAADIARDRLITATFSEAVDAATFADDAFQVAIEGEPIDGAVAVDGAVATFTPADQLAGGTSYTVTISTAVTDLAGNPLAEPEEWLFTTQTSTCVKNGGGNGCLPTLAAAIAASAPGESIAVAAGTYSENLAIDKTVVLLGGFSDDFTRRNPAELSSIIEPEDETVPIIYVNGVFGDTAAVTPTIDGFTLTGASASDHGGAIHGRSSDFVLRDSTVVNNAASFLGGGVYVIGGGPLLIRNRIEGNTVNDEGASGGGVMLENTVAILIGNLIEDNEAPGNATAGGGIAITGGAPVILTDNVVRNNRVGGLDRVAAGGGIDIGGGAFVFITGGEISGNEVIESGPGGGLNVANSTVTVEGTRIVDNAAGAAGGTGSGVAVENSDLIIKSSLIAGNRNGQAGLWLGLTSPAAVVSCTIADNPGQGVRTETDLAIANSVLMDEPVGLNVAAAVPVTATGNDFFANTTDATGVDLDGSNLFEDPGVGEDFRLAEDSALVDVGVPGPFTVAGLNDAVALPEIDVDGEPRVMIGASGAARVDVGADEVTGPIEP